MGARVSLVRLGLAGLGRFVFLTSAICVGMIIAISGPPTASETAGLSSAIAHGVRRFDSAALHFTFDLCDSVPVAAHAAGLCATPAAEVARAAPPRPRQIEIAAVSETLPPSAREILPPDTIDQIARSDTTGQTAGGDQHRSELLGEGRPASHVAHPARILASRTLASRTLASRNVASRTLARAASVGRARTLRASVRRSTRAAAGRARLASIHARAVRVRPHPPPAPARRVHATPIVAPQAIAAPALAAPTGRQTPAPTPATAADRAPAPEPSPPPPEEHANVAADEHAPPPPAQSDEDKQPNNPQSDDPTQDDPAQEDTKS